MAVFLVQGKWPPCLDRFGEGCNLRGRIRKLIYKIRKVGNIGYKTLEYLSVLTLNIGSILVTVLAVKDDLASVFVCIGYPPP